MEDGADAQEEAPEDGPQLGDQVELHHLTQVGVVAGSMGLELEKEKVRQKIFTIVFSAQLSTPNMQKEACIYSDSRPVLTS